MIRIKRTYILLSLLCLLLSSCSNNKVTSEGNAPAGSSAQHSANVAGNVNVDKLIGSSILSYPEYRPVNDDFSESLFKNRATITDKNASMPIYRIEIDQNALHSAVEKLQRKFHLTKQGDEDGVITYANDKKVLAVNDEIGSLQFKDLKIFQVEAGVRSVDKTKLLKVAQSIFEDLIPKDLLKKTYFYRYGEYIDSASEGEKLLPDLIYEVAVGLNTTVDGIPIIGSGGKYGLELTPDGEIASIDMQFARFIKTDDIVKIKDSTSVLNQTKKEAEDSGINFDKYQIPRKEFGYVYQSKKGAVKWLVPAYSIFISPKEGEAGSATAYFVPASDDSIAHERFNEDIRSEENRKAFHYEHTGVPQENEKPVSTNKFSPKIDSEKNSF